MAGLASAALTGFRADPTDPRLRLSPGAPVPKMTQEKDSKPGFLAVAFRHEPLRWVLKIGEIELEPPMRSILAGATALLLSGSAVAEPANPTQLAETAAYLLGNAHRCGVADERVEPAGTAIRDLIVVAARDSAEAAAAESRFVEIFLALAAPSQDRDGFPSCKVVIARFERLEGHHQEAGLTN